MDKARFKRMAEAVSEKRKREDLLTEEDKILLLAYFITRKQTRLEQGYTDQ